MLVQYFKLQFMQHFIHKTLPKSFHRMWTTNAERRLEHELNNDDVNYNNPVDLILRNDSDFYVPYSRLSLTDRFPLSCISKLWNSLHDENIKIQHNKNSFNNLLKKHYLSQLQDNYKCERLLCPHCLTAWLERLFIPLTIYHLQFFIINCCVIAGSLCYSVIL